MCDKICLLQHFPKCAGGRGTVYGGRSRRHFIKHYAYYSALSPTHFVGAPYNEVMAGWGLLLTPIPTHSTQQLSCKLQYHSDFIYNKAASNCLTAALF